MTSRLFSWWSCDDRGQIPNFPGGKLDMSFSIGKCLVVSAEIHRVVVRDSREMGLWGDFDGDGPVLGRRRR
jgi:hypothetical protein